MPAVQVRGRFVTFTTQGEGAKMRLVGLFTDGTATIEVVWFRRIKALKELYQTGREYILFGKPQAFNNRWSMVHPEVDPPDAPGAAEGLRGVYPLTENCETGASPPATYSPGYKTPSKSQAIFPKPYLHRL